MKKQQIKIDINSLSADELSRLAQDHDAGQLAGPEYRQLREKLEKIRVAKREKNQHQKDAKKRRRGSRIDLLIGVLLKYFKDDERRQKEAARQAEVEAARQAAGRKEQRAMGNGQWAIDEEQAIRELYFDAEKQAERIAGYKAAKEARRLAHLAQFADQPQPVEPGLDDDMKPPAPKRAA